MAQGVSRPPFASASRIAYDAENDEFVSKLGSRCLSRAMARQIRMSFETTEERCLCLPRTSSELMTGWNRLSWRGGRLQIDTELRELIWRMSVENPLWGAPRIRGELLMGVPNSVILAKPFAPAQLVTAISNLLNTVTPPAAPTVDHLS